MNDLYKDKDGVVHGLIELPCYGIIVNLTGDGGGAVTSDLQEKETEDNADEHESIRLFNAAMDGIESTILAHACAGIDIESPAYVEGIETAVLACGNNF